MKKITHILAITATLLTFLGCSVEVNINPDTEKKNESAIITKDPRSVKITEWQLDSKGYLGSNYIIDGLEIDGWVEKHATFDGDSFSFTPTEESKKLMPTTLQDNEQYFLQKYDRNMLTSQEYENYVQNYPIKIKIVAAYERTEGLPTLMLQK